MANPPKTVDPEGPNDPHSLKGAHILVVDDEQHTRDTLERVLLASGATVVLASSAIEALDKLDSVELPFDAAVVDYYLLDERGVEVVRALKQAANPCCALMMTGAEELDLGKLAFQAGADEFLRKPFGIKDLRGALLRVLQKTKYWRRVMTEPEVNHAAEGLPLSPPTPQSPKALAASVSKKHRLTQRQTQVLEHMLKGKKYQKIADDTGLKLRTVRFHSSNVLSALNLKDKNELLTLFFPDSGSAKSKTSPDDESEE